MPAERIMQSAYDAMRTVQMILKDRSSNDPDIRQCIHLLEGAMGCMPQSKRREDNALHSPAIETPLSLDRDQALTLMRSEKPVSQQLAEAFAMGVAEARGDECAQKARHMRLLSYMRAQEVIANREESVYFHEMNDDTDAHRPHA